MQAVVPAAGEGTRLRPHTTDKPKGLVAVAGRPLLEHVFEQLSDLSVKEIVIVIGYKGTQVREYFGDTYNGIQLAYVRQPERRGLAHAVEVAAQRIEDDFLLHNGDNVCRANLDALIEQHSTSGAIGTALVESVSADRATEAGVFEIEDGKVSGLAEKPDEPPSTLIPRGVWAFDRRIVHACALVTAGHTGERELSDAIDLCLHAGWDVETVGLDGWIQNVNTPTDIKVVEDRLD